MVKRTLLFGTILVLLVATTAFILPPIHNPTASAVNEPAAVPAADAKYIGVAACVMCHRTDQQGKQEAIWKESLHAKAYETLKSEQSKKIATDKGITKAPHEAQECLVCHATGWDLPAERLDARFKVEDGVQCETCHGAGSEYRAVHGRNPELGMERGLVIGDEQLCKTCHNEKSPTFKGFDFKRDMAKIAHPVPEK
jgi:hypothetical protein